MVNTYDTIFGYLEKLKGQSPHLKIVMMYISACDIFGGLFPKNLRPKKIQNYKGYNKQYLLEWIKQIQLSVGNVTKNMAIGKPPWAY